jgi:hypothetical protein
MDRASHPSLPPSIPADASAVLGAARLLAHVESLPHDATGMLECGSEGMLLIEQRSICWAVASGMRKRLSTLLRTQRSPPLDSSYIEELLRECRERGTPLGEALLSTGHISEEGLRTALYHHIAEAVGRIGKAGTCAYRFVPHASASYAARFSFSTAEVLAALGGSRDRAQAAAAKRALRTSLIPGSRGLAFVRDDSGPIAIAVEGTPALRVPEILDMCSWACSLFDVSTIFDSEVRVATGTSLERNAVVTWRSGETQFVALCENRAASALLVSRLDEAL